MAISASMVKELREMTGAGMMDCKKALVETDGDMDKAVEFLREKGLAKAAKKAGRIAAEGLVRLAFSDDHREAVVVEVNSETDFVSKNPEFVQFVEDVAAKALEQKNNDIEEFMNVDFDGEGTLQNALSSKIAKIGENMNIRRFFKCATPGVVYTGYIHGGGRIGVLVGIETEATFEEIEYVGKDVAMQVASMNPKFVNEDEVDKEELLERIIPGKIKALLKEVCLVDQKFVKNGDITVAQYVDEESKKIGKSMKVVEMVRFEVGEGIEKKEEDFAAEVAAQQAAASK